MKAYLHAHWLKLSIVLLLLAAAAWWLTRDGGFSKDRLMNFAQDLPVGWFFAAFLALPLLGLPVTPFLLLCGLRYGFLGGIVAVSSVMVVHNIVAFHIVHGRLRKWMSDRLFKNGHKMPTPSEKNQLWFTAAFVAVQGPPYAVKLYSLALTEIPFHIYFLVGTPIYIFFALIPIGAGSSAVAVNPIWMYAGVFGIMGMIFLVRWIRRRLSAKSDDSSQSHGDKSENLLS